MKSRKSPDKLAKFLSYLLGRRPDEVGLIPDPEGWVDIKELLQAMNEEEGWRYVRRGSLDEVLLCVPSPPVEISDKRIRAVQRDRLPGKQYAESPGKLLYTGITRKSHPSVTEKGIFPTRHPHITLSNEKSIAKRIARRREPSPVILTVNVDLAAAAGSVFYQAGESLFITDFIAPGCFTGPPLPNLKPETRKKKVPPEPEKPKTPGSFVLDLTKGPADKKERDPARAGSWKRDKKRIRREKKKGWPG